MQDFIEFKYWPLLLKASWQAAVIVLLVLAAQRALGRRLTPRWRCGLWLLVALRLALPWTFPSSVSLFNLVNFSRSSETAVIRQAIHEQLDSPSLPPTAPALADGPAQRVAPPAAAAPGFRVSLAWLPLLWGAGALGLALYLVIAHFRLWRRVTACRPLISDQTMNVLEDCKQRMGVRVPVALVETAAVDGPCLFGFVRPRLLLPRGFTRNFSPDELRHVFLHELGHIKRRDIPLGWLMAVLQILHWFNPLVWLAFSRMRMDRELACDALALSHADERDNKPYGLTIVKLLESFGNSVRAPSLAGIVEDKQQMKERIRMIAQFPRSKGGFALAATVLAGLAVLTLTDCTTGSKTPKVPVTQSPGSTNPWVEQQQRALSQPGISWAAYELWDAYYRGNHGAQRDPAQAGKYLRLLTRNLFVVRFESVGDDAPPTPTAFLERLHHYADTGQTNSALGGFFRTKQQNGKLAGSFLSSLPDQLKANLANVPGIKVTSVEPITPEQFIQYEQSRQESLDHWNKSNLDRVLGSARGGDLLAAYDLWDAFHRGAHGVQPDPAQADKWLEQFVQNLWIIKLEPVGDFKPATPKQLLDRVNQYPQPDRGTNTGVVSGFFRTKGQGGKLMGSFLTHIPDQLKASLDNVPGIKVISVEPISRDQFIQYEQSRQEPMTDANHLDASQGVWAVRFEPVGDFAPKIPGEFLARIPVYSGQRGEIGYFRTKKQGDKLAGSFLANDPDQLKAALAALPGIKVTSVEKLTQEQLDAYEKSPQESLTSQTGNTMNARQSALFVKFKERSELDQKNHTPEQLEEAEKLYQVANTNWGTPDTIASLKQMVEKFPDMNRTGCACLYLAQQTSGPESEKYLTKCLQNYNDCYYGDGVQVGAYARFYLANYYKDANQTEKADALFKDIKDNYPDAIDHQGERLINLIK